jgi:ribonuclease HI
MINIYTDWSSIGNPGQGGWAFLVLTEKWHSIQHQSAGGESYTTNNRMELTAVIQALVYCKELKLFDHRITLHMDSMYVHDGISKHLSQRVRRGRRLANKRPVQNKDLRLLLHDLLPKFPNLSLKRVKAHATNKYNNIIDELAREAALRMPILSDMPKIYPQSNNDDPMQKSLF